MHLEHHSGFGEICGFGQLRGELHVFQHLLGGERPVLRHQQVDEEFCAVRTRRGVMVAEIAAEGAGDGVAHDAAVARLAQIGVIDEVEKRVGAWRTLNQR